MVETTLGKINRTVLYSIKYRYPTCFDDGESGGSHDEGWGYSTDKIEAKSDKQAQLISLSDQFHRKELCYHGRFSYPIEIQKRTIEVSQSGWTRDITITVPLPKVYKCGCGKEYWPVKDEKPCHKLVELVES